MTNSFLDGKFNKRDLLYSIWLLIVLAIILYEYFESSAFGTTYFPVIIVTLFILAASIISYAIDYPIFGEVVNGGLRSFLPSEDGNDSLGLAWLGLGIILIISNVLAGVTIYAIATHPNITNLFSLSASGIQIPSNIFQHSILGDLFLYTVVGTAAEVGLFVTALLVTIIVSIRKDSVLVALYSLVIGVVFYFFFGTLSILIFFVAIAFIFLGSRLANLEIIQHPAIAVILGLLIMGGVVALYHYHLFSGQGDWLVLIGFGGLFFMGVAAFCVLCDTAHPAWILYCANDVGVLCVQNGYSLWYAVAMLAIVNFVIIITFVVRSGKTGAIINKVLPT